MGCGLRGRERATQCEPPAVRPHRRAGEQLLAVARHARPHQAWGVGGMQLPPHQDQRGVPLHTRRPGARDIAFVMRSRALRALAMRFCITHVMLNATRLPPAGTQWAWPWRAAQQARSRRAECAHPAARQAPYRFDAACKGTLFELTTPQPGGRLACACKPHDGRVDVRW